MLQSNLSVLQKAETFDSFYQVLQLIEELSDTVNNKIEEVNALEDQKKPQTLKLLMTYKSLLDSTYTDIRFVLFCNLDALLRDGRITLKKLLNAGNSNFVIKPQNLFNLIFRVD